MLNFCAVWAVCTFSYFYLSSGTCVVAYWGIVAHSVYDIFLGTMYKYLSVILVFANPRFVEWEFLSDCAIF